MSQQPRLQDRYSINLDYENSNDNLATEFNLACESKALFMQVFFMALFMGSLANILIEYNVRKRIHVTFFLTMGQGISIFFCLFFRNKIFLIEMFFFLKFFFYQLLKTNQVLVLIENFDEEHRNVITMLNYFSESG